MQERSERDVDPDVGPLDLARAGGFDRARLLTAVAAGGVIGAIARHGTEVRWPQSPGEFGWSVLAVNVLGAGLLGILMATLRSGRPRHRLVRPFLGVGVLGGFTTFSSSMLDTQRLLAYDLIARGIGHLFATFSLSVVALGLAASMTSRVLAPRPRSGGPP